MNPVTDADSVKLKRYREAGDWLLRVKSPGASEAEVEEWLRWCEVDAENLAVFEKLQMDWQDAAGLKSAPELLDASRHAGERHRDSASSTFKRLLSSNAVRFGVAAGVLLAGAFGFQLMYRVPLQVVAASNREPATLPDGSSLTLSAKATADVDFSGITRQLALRPGSEAYIKVRHDKLRPFTVRAGTMTVTAVGTAFDVRREADRVIVTVEEGSIVASAVGSNGLNEWRAGAGYQVEYAEVSRTAIVSRVDTERVLRWRDGELAYDDTPLDAVIADINRYSSVTVAVKDPALLRLHFTGTVFVASVNDWVKALEAKYPVHVTVSAGGDINLESPVTGAASH